MIWYLHALPAYICTFFPFRLPTLVMMALLQVWIIPTFSASELKTPAIFSTRSCSQLSLPWGSVLRFLVDFFLDLIECDAEL